MNMKAEDVETPVSPALWSVSQWIKKEIKEPVDFGVSLDRIPIEKVKHFVLGIKPISSWYRKQWVAIAEYPGTNSRYKPALVKASKRRINIIFLIARIYPVFSIHKY